MTEETTPSTPAKKSTPRKQPSASTRKPKSSAKRSAASATRKKAKPAKRAKKKISAATKAGKASFVIWVDKKQGAFIKAKAKKAGMTQADYFRRALKLPPSR